MEDETPSERMARVARKFDERQQKETSAWHPAETVERTAWNVVGCWQMLVAEVNFAYFHAAGPGAPPFGKDGLPAKIRKVAEMYGVRWPHDAWSGATDKVSKVRHRLAHLLYIDSITGEEPHRTMTIMRLGAPGSPRKDFDGQPGELSWRYVPDENAEPDDVAWSQMTMHLDSITEDELSDALAALRWMRNSCRIMTRLGDIVREMKPGPLKQLPVHEQDLLQWWFPDWGDRATARLTWGDVLTVPTAQEN